MWHTVYQNFDLSTYLQGLEEESLQTSCSDTELSEPAKSSNTQEKSCCNDNEMESCQSSQFGMTLRHSTELTGEEELTWFAEDFPVRTYHPQVKEKDFQVVDQDCGPRWQESLARYNPDTYSWRTHQCSLIEGLETYSETFPRWATMRNGELFHARTQVEFICENASGFSLPTPRSCTAMTAPITNNTGKHKHPNLEVVVARLFLPTICKSESKGSGRKRFIGSPDFRGAKMSEGLRTCKEDPIYLNHLFAEKVMMFPSMWTSLQPLEMHKFQEWQQQHSLSLNNDLNTNHNT